MSLLTGYVDVGWGKVEIKIYNCPTPGKVDFSGLYTILQRFLSTFQVKKWAENLLVTLQLLCELTKPALVP